MTTATAKAIRNRVLDLVEAITPTSLSGDAFRRYRNEGGGDFHAFAQSAPQIRRFQVRDTGDDAPPSVSDMLVEERILDLDVTVAYPQDSRAGSTNALGRDDIIAEDWKAIDNAIGWLGAGNFSGAYDCTPLGATKSVERAGKVDFLIVKARFQFWRTTT